MPQGKFGALVWIAVAYAAGIVAAVFAGREMQGAHPLLVVAVADAVGTAVIFLFSLAFNNSSFYDPYWSVAPMVMVLYWSFDADQSGSDVIRQRVVAVLVWAWGARLTYNFLKGWPNARHEDWRYVNIRKANGRRYWLVSFFGIHFAPTAWVYFGCLAFYPAFTSARPFGGADVFAALFTAGAIALEAVADRQLWKFRRANPEPGAIMKSGLWRTSRHPNYLGEISFWWGLYFIGVSADLRVVGERFAPGWGHPTPWWTIAGPLGITLLFVFISIPMINKRHLARRPGYADHMRVTSALIPVGRKRRS